MRTKYHFYNVEIAASDTLNMDFDSFEDMQKWFKRRRINGTISVAKGSYEVFYGNIQDFRKVLRFVDTNGIWPTYAPWEIYK